MSLVDKIKQYVKPVPWLQWVSTIVLMAPHVNLGTAALAAAVAAGALGIRTREIFADPNSPKFRFALQAVGIAAAGVGAVAGFHFHVPVLNDVSVQFLGAAVALTGMGYELIYP